MPTSFPDSARDTRNRLLEAALLVFAEKGFDGAGIRDIAARAKANSAMVQYHFGGKEGLFLAVMRFTFEQGTQWIQSLPPVPAPGAPGARDGALASLRTYIRSFLAQMLNADNNFCRLASEELDRASHQLWSREMQFPRPILEPFLQESVRPFVDYLEDCLRVLCPGLDDEARLRLGFSVQALVMWVHTHMGLIRILRGAAYGPADLDSLTEHYFRFCLGGFGLDQDRPGQGA
jgi:TetR/AcrR family transcriptional regulator, regulator of cefoperazone and chloramphenicol sensitivity